MRQYLPIEDINNTASIIYPISKGYGYFDNQVIGGNYFDYAASSNTANTILVRFDNVAQYISVFGAPVEGSLVYNINSFISFNTVPYATRTCGVQGSSAPVWYNISNYQTLERNNRTYYYTLIYARNGAGEQNIYNQYGIYADCEVFTDVDMLLATIPFVGGYPITYSSSNSTVSGPSEAAVGDTVTVSAVPDVGYGITDASTQILVTNDDVAVPYTWDAVNNRITFTMPQPAANRGGFGSTGQ